MTKNNKNNLLEHTCYLSTGKTITFRDIVWSEWEKMLHNPSIILRCITQGKIETEEDFQEYFDCLVGTVTTEKPRKPKKGEEDM